MFPYIPHTPEDIKEMLEVVGVDSTDDLFADISKASSLNRELNLPKAKSELEVVNYLTSLANKNCSATENICFLGAGAYDHYIPTIVDHIISRSEFYTSYTPYQPEISQGTLQYLFEYQTLISELTGLPIANASLYDGGTAVTEAALMACDVGRKKKILVSKTVSPQTREILKTYAHVQSLELVEIEMKDGITDMEDFKAKMDDEVGAAIVQSPNFFGIVEDLKASADLVHTSKKGAIIASVDPISLGILKRPGDLGVDIVVGEGQALGIPMQFGGPYLGFLATTEKYLRKLPGRIVGETTDLDGKRSFVLTLTAREQHIRRDKATSNICSNQGLNTLAATVYMVTLGKEGLREVAMQSTQKAHYALEKLEESGKFKRVFDQPFFKEFAVSSDIDADKIITDLRGENIIGGYDLGIDYPEFKNSILYAVTEKRTKDEIDKLSNVLEGM
nr:aminomethyl-transferring glycine dehydrogenase subunit GcvPA [Tissierella sp.]